MKWEGLFKVFDEFIGLYKVVVRFFLIDLTLFVHHTADGNRDRQGAPEGGAGGQAQGVRQDHAG